MNICPISWNIYSLFFCLIIPISSLPGAAEELEGGPGGGQMPEDAQEED